MIIQINNRLSNVIKVEFKIKKEEMLLGKDKKIKDLFLIFRVVVGLNWSLFQGIRIRKERRLVGWEALIKAK